MACSLVVSVAWMECYFPVYFPMRAIWDNWRVVSNPIGFVWLQFSNGSENAIRADFFGRLFGGG